MNKCWFLWLNSKQEGPFSYIELEQHPLLTPDTLVWKEGMADWTPVRDVPELKNIFKNEEEEEENVEQPESKLPEDDEIVLPMQSAEPPLFLWVLAALAIILYVVIRNFK